MGKIGVSRMEETIKPKTYLLTTFLEDYESFNEIKFTMNEDISQIFLHGDFPVRNINIDSGQLLKDLNKAIEPIIFQLKKKYKEDIQKLAEDI